MRAMRDADNFDIPMTSLIDVVFLLLIFFLVATNFIHREMDQKVKLPESEAGVKPAAVTDRLVINIRDNGTIVINGSISNETELRAVAKDFANNHPDRPAVVRADGKVAYESVMRVFGICRLNGIKNVDLPVLEPTKP